MDWLEFLVIVIFIGAAFFLIYYYFRGLKETFQLHGLLRAGLMSTLTEGSRTLWMNGN